MGVETKGLLKGKVDHEEVLNFIQQKYDINAKSHVELTNYGLDSECDWIKEKYDNTGKRLIWSGFIWFYDGEKRRSLFYCYANCNAYCNLEYYAEIGLADMVKSETTYLSIDCYGLSKEIMKEIVTHFGGWIDENSYDDESYYPVVKNTDGTIKPVIRVTMEEICEKFGGVVIITK